MYSKEEIKQKLEKCEVQIHFDDRNKVDLLRELMRGYAGIEGVSRYYVLTTEGYDIKTDFPFDLPIIKISEIIEEPNNIEVISEEVVKENYDFINPNHYKKFSVEVIDMMASIWGKEATAIHCEMCAFKYRLRMGEKPDQPIERDLEKVNWYLSKAKELKTK